MPSEVQPAQSTQFITGQWETLYLLKSFPNLQQRCQFCLLMQLVFATPDVFSHLLQGRGEAGSKRQAAEPLWLQLPNGGCISQC